MRLGHAYVGLRNQLAFDQDRDIRFGEGGRHEQRAEELTAEVALEPNRAATQPLAPDQDRRAARSRLAASGHVELAQSAEQVLDRPFAHSSHTIEAKLPRTDAHRRSQKAHAGAGVADEEFRALGRNAAVERPFGSWADDDDFGLGPVAAYLES